MKLIYHTCPLWHKCVVDTYTYTNAYIRTYNGIWVWFLLKIIVYSYACMCMYVCGIRVHVCKALKHLECVLDFHFLWRTTMLIVFAIHSYSCSRYGHIVSCHTKHNNHQIFMNNLLTLIVKMLICVR